jgi:transcriptional regulator with XRE-family HTH domain
VSEAEQPRGEDWDAVAEAIQTRLAQTRMTQLDVASRARLSLTTVRELQHNLNPRRRRRPQTLAAVSQALGWPPDYLQHVLNGDQPQPHEDEVKDPVLHALDGLARQIQELRERVEQIEHQLAAEDAKP